MGAGGWEVGVGVDEEKTPERGVLPMTPPMVPCEEEACKGKRGGRGGWCKRERGRREEGEGGRGVEGRRG